VIDIIAVIVIIDVNTHEYMLQPRVALSFVAHCTPNNARIPRTIMEMKWYVPSKAEFPYAKSRNGLDTNDMIIV